MEWFDVLSQKEVGHFIFACILGLLAFAWSAIFWYAARTLTKLTKSVDGLHTAVAQLFERLVWHSNDIKEIKRRITKLEGKK